VNNEKKWRHRIEVVRPARRKARKKRDEREVDPKIDYKDLDSRLDRDKDK
jgi:hypothetical protein